MPDQLDKTLPIPVVEPLPELPNEEVIVGEYENSIRILKNSKLLTGIVDDEAVIVDEVAEIKRKQRPSHQNHQNNDNDNDNNNDDDDDEKRRDLKTPRRKRPKIPKIG